MVCFGAFVFAACSEGANDETPDEKPEPCVEHVFGEWETDTASTCSVAGRKKRACTVCGEFEYEDLPLDNTNHAGAEFTEWLETTPPTCTARGVRVHTCKNCDTQISEDVPVDPTAHLYGPWRAGATATCSAEGTKIRTCAYCDAIQTDKTAIDPDNHNFVSKSKTPSTCATHGSEHFECSLCGKGKDVDLPLSSEHSFVSALGAENRCEHCGQLLTASVTLDTTATVGEVGYGSALTGDFKLEYTFDNFGGSNADGWHNWTFSISPGIYENGKLFALPFESMFLRARTVSDNDQGRYFKEFGSVRYLPNIVDSDDPNDGEVSGRWFAEAMKNANCKAVIERKGDTVTVNVVSTSNMTSDEFTYTASFEIVCETLFVRITGESCKLTVKRIALISGQIAPPTVEVSTQGTELLDGDVSFTNSGGRQHNGYSVSLDAGDLDIVYKFTNAGGTGNKQGWHNYYFNVYKCFATRGDDNSVLWALGSNNEEATYNYTFTEENWTGRELNTHNQFGFGAKADGFVQKMTDASVEIRFVRKNGVLNVFGAARTSSGEFINAVIYRSQGRAYDGPLTLALMSENSSVTVKSVKLVRGELCTGHEFGEWTVEKPAVCENDGVKKRVCGICGAIETETVPATGVHSFKPDAGVGEKCEHCNEILKEARAFTASGALGEIKEGYSFVGDFEVTYEFENRGGDNGGAWHNWSLQTIPVEYFGGKRTVLTPVPGDSAFTVVRLRTVQGSGAVGMTVTYAPVIDGSNEGEVTAAMRDAVCTATIKRVGDKVGIKVVSESRVAGHEGKKYTCTAEYTVASVGLYVALSGENCSLKLTGVKCKTGTLAPETKTVAAGTDAITAPVEFTNADREGNGYTLTLGEGDFDVTFVYDNRGGTGNGDGYHNSYFNLYKGKTEAKDNADVLWAFAPNGLEPTWQYGKADGNLFNAENHRFAAYPADFVQKMTNAKVYMRVVRKNGVISVYGAAYTADGEFIGHILHVGNGTYAGEVSMRLMSEKSSVSLQHVYIASGSKV